MNYIESQLAVISIISCLLKHKFKTCKERAQEVLTIYNKEFPALHLSSFVVIKTTKKMIALLNKHSNEIIISFRDSSSILTSLSNLYLRAKTFTEKIMSLYPTSRILLTGYHAGGTIAELVNSSLNEKKPFSRNICVTFDPLHTAESIFIPGTNIPYYSAEKNLTRIKTSYSNSPQNIQRHQNSPSTINTSDIICNLLTSAKNRGSQEMASVGGVDLAFPTEIIEELRMNNAISGISVGEFECFYITEENNEENGLLMSDLAVALLVTYSDIRDTKISFSLDPYYPKNPYGDYQRKVYWPDFNENYSIISGTNLGSVLFECDLWMKRMSLDTFSTEYPVSCITQRLKDLGLSPIHSITLDNSWHRLWLVIESVSIEKSRNAEENSISVKSVKIAVKSKQMIRNDNGELEDSKDQYYDGGCIFAEKFTELYDEISKDFPIFKRLKQVVRAVFLAEYMKLNHIPVDFEKVKTIVGQAKVIEDDWIFSINSQYREGDKYIHIFGGADLSIDNKYALLEDEFIQEYRDVNQLSNQITITNVNNQAMNNQKAIFNLFPTTNCAACNQKLSLKEQMYSKNIMYCYSHNSDLCHICLLPVNGNFLKISEKCYHEECLRCKICERLITSSERHIIIPLGFIHANCCKNLQEVFNSINSRNQKMYAEELEKSRKDGQERNNANHITNAQKAKNFANNYYRNKN